MSATFVPSAKRVAQIIRSCDQDLGPRIAMTQQRLAGCGPCALSVLPGGGLATGATVDSKVGQLAERVSVLIAGVQQRCETDKQDGERRLEELDARVDARVRALEARVAACERLGDVESRVPDAASLREVRAVVDTGLADASAQWSGHLSGLRSELRGELAGRLEELTERLRAQAARLDRAEAGLEGQDRTLERSAELLREHEEQLQGVLGGLERGRDLAPEWYGQLEGAVASLERCVEEHRMASEVEQQRLHFDVEALRRRSADSMLGLREELARTLEVRLESELARFGAQLRGVQEQQQANLAAARAAPADRWQPDDWQGVSREVWRRLEDMEARLSALRVRADGQDGRLATVADRAEGACQQAQDAARQVALQQREDILSETDCQLRILRQRVDTLSDLCEEVVLRHAPDAGGAPGDPGLAARSALRRQEELAPLRRSGRPPPQPLR